MLVEPPAGCNAAPPPDCTGVPCATAVPGATGEPTGSDAPPFAPPEPGALLLLFEPLQAATMPPAAITAAPLNTRRREARRRALRAAISPKRTAASESSLSVEYFTASLLRWPSSLASGRNSRRTARRSVPAQPGVEHVPRRIAEDAVGEDDARNRDAGRQRQPRPLLHVGDRAGAEHHAPVGVAAADEAEKRQRRLDQQVHAERD